MKNSFFTMKIGVHCSTLYRLLSKAKISLYNMWIQNTSFFGQELISPNSNLLYPSKRNIKSSCDMKYTWCPIVPKFFQHRLILPQGWLMAIVVYILVCKQETDKFNVVTNTVRENNGLIHYRTIVRNNKTLII